MSSSEKNSTYIEHVRNSLVSLMESRKEMEGHFERNMREEYDRICEAQLKDFVELLKLGEDYSEDKEAVRLDLGDGRTAEFLKKEVLDYVGADQYSILFPKDDTSEIVSSNDDNTTGDLMDPYAFDTGLARNMMDPFTMFAASYSAWIKNYVTQKDKTRAEINSLKADKENAERERELSEKATENAVLKLDALENEKSRLMSELKELRDKIRSIENDKNAQANKVKSKDEYIERLKKEASEKDTRIKELEKELEEIRSDNKKAEDGKASLSRKIEEKDNRIRNLEKELKDLRKKNDELNASVVSLTEIAYKDSKFDVLNIQNFNRRIFNGREDLYIVGFIDICGLTDINREWQEDAGDKAISAVLSTLQGIFSHDNVYRARGGQFYVVYEGESVSSLKEVLNKTRNDLQDNYDLDVVFGCGEVKKSNVPGSLRYLRHEAMEMYSRIKSGKEIPESGVNEVIIETNITAGRGEHRKAPGSNAYRIAAPDNNSGAVKGNPNREIKKTEKSIEEIRPAAEEPGSHDNISETEITTEMPVEEKEAVISKNPNVNLPIYVEEDDDASIKEQDSTSYNLANDILKLALNRKRN